LAKVLAPTLSEQDREGRLRRRFARWRFRFSPLAHEKRRYGLPGASRAGKFGAGAPEVGGDSRSGRIGFADDGAAGMVPSVFIRRSESRLTPD
jgi:hypothetical protein